uniref:Uncharacterized protein n=1 Tax=Siphoviridae sp. ct9lR64 TaxID=2826178 RepID=A0A8S5QXB6_9CAUD|nr:MAG TPA: hypothetical protein [Siphoviridae sp. ct9lR64]
MKFKITKSEIARIVVGGLFMALGNIVMELMNQGDLNATIEEEVNKQIMLKEKFNPEENKNDNDEEEV